MTERPRAERRYWLDESRNVDRVAYTLYALCAAVFLTDLFYGKHPHFDFEHWFGFYAGYGFVSAAVLVLLAKQMRRILIRDEEYYEPEDADRQPGRPDERGRGGHAE